LDPARPEQAIAETAAACSAQRDGLGHIFDHGRPWNGRDAADVVTSEGDRGTGRRSSPAAAFGHPAHRAVHRRDVGPGDPGGAPGAPVDPIAVK